MIMITIIIIYMTNVNVGLENKIIFCMMFPSLV